MRYLILIFSFGLCLISCNSESKPIQDYSKTDTTASVIIAKFITLDFEAGGKINTAAINQDYIGFKNKKDFPLSLFITINSLDKPKDGKPTEKEEQAFASLEDHILSQLSNETKYCYVGRTRMDGYRDMIFYITSKDQKKVSDKLKEIQAKETRIKEFTFENDPEWDAVSEFYEAIKIKKQL